MSGRACRSAASCASVPEGLAPRSSCRGWRAAGRASGPEVELLTLPSAAPELAAREADINGMLDPPSAGRDATRLTDFGYGLTVARPFPRVSGRRKPWPTSATFRGLAIDEPPEPAANHLTRSCRGAAGRAGVVGMLAQHGGAAGCASACSRTTRGATRSQAPVPQEARTRTFCPLRTRDWYWLAHRAVWDFLRAQRRGGGGFSAFRSELVTRKRRHGASPLPYDRSLRAVATPARHDHERTQPATFVMHRARLSVAVGAPYRRGGVARRVPRSCSRVPRGA